jgi:hypothetical protein
VVPFFTKPVFVEDQHALLVAELFSHVCLEVVAQGVGVPAAVGQKVLQAMWGGVAGVLGQLPAVLASDRAEQSADVIPHPLPGFHAAEAGSGAQEEFFEFQVPGVRRCVVHHDYGLLAGLSLHAARAHVGGTARPRPSHACQTLATLPTARPLTSRNTKVRLEY